MALKDSIDKIVQSYFVAVTKTMFEYKNKVYRPAKTLSVSPLLFRGFICPSHCGGCCSRFSLDYLPSEEQPPGLKRRNVKFNGYVIAIDSDLQEEGDHFCQHLDRDNGRCLIHDYNPFSCDFELIRFLIPVDIEKGGSAYLTQKLYGRGWNFKRIDGKRGALCEMTDPDEHSRREVIRKLHRLDRWTRHFHLEHTWIPEILDWVADGPHTEPLRLHN